MRFDYYNFTVEHLKVLHTLDDGQSIETIACDTIINISKF